MNAQAAPFFPPAYFWVFVFAADLVIVGGLVLIIVFIKRAQYALRIKERELAAHLIEVMLTQQNLSPQEIEQVLNSYWRLGTFWGRFRGLWPEANPPHVEVPPQKTLAA